MEIHIYSETCQKVNQADDFSILKRNLQIDNHTFTGFRIDYA